MYPFENTPRLGLGMMRLPTDNGEPNIAAVSKMVDTFLEKGYRYFDTAYGYHGGKSETTLREALVKRHDRSEFLVADKLPSWHLHKHGDAEALFSEQLMKTGLDYFDYYLLHAVSKSYTENYQATNAWAFLVQKKAEGAIRHLGFSFHDTPEYLDEFLTAHPEAEFVQLQINYADWESSSVCSRRCYEVAQKHGKPVIVMEPIKGGSLAALTPAARGILSRKNHSTPAEWALRFCASLDGVAMILSGMSTQEQLEQNIETFNGIKPLSADEQDVLKEVVEEFNRTPTIPCTACRYCVDGCPAQIQIPDLFSLYNSDLTYGTHSDKGFANTVKEKGLPSACLACGQCESVCPQHINIIEQLKKISSIYEK